MELVAEFTILLLSLSFTLEQPLYPRVVTAPPPSIRSPTIQQPLPHCMSLQCMRILNKFTSSTAPFLVSFRVHILLSVHHGWPRRMGNGDSDAHRSGGWGGGGWDMVDGHHHQHHGFASVICILWMWPVTRQEVKGEKVQSEITVMVSYIFSRSPPLARSSIREEVPVRQRGSRGLEKDSPSSSLVRWMCLKLANRKWPVQWDWPSSSVVLLMRCCATKKFNCPVLLWRIVWRVSERSDWRLIAAAVELFYWNVLIFYSLLFFTSLRSPPPANLVRCKWKSARIDLWADDQTN